MTTPFYDPTISYEENYDKGPFGAFADGKVYPSKGEPTFDYHGTLVYTPFGIPAGPVVNSTFVKAAFEKGFDICVYKTVRSDFYPCHPVPNVLPVEIDGKLTLGKRLVTKEGYDAPLSITNSFGVPSKNTETWQEDVKKALSYAGKGQVLVLSFMGTVREGQTKQEFIDDHKNVAARAMETGASHLEVNLSCPNIGNEGLICYDLTMTEKILKAIRSVIGDTPLGVKIGYFEDVAALEKLAGIINEYGNTIAGINTIPAEVVDKEGNQALPGENRLKSGICGSGIQWAGLDTVKRLKSFREKHGYSYMIEGMGGVMSSEDYKKFKDAGADIVMSATGAMWNPMLAQEVKTKI